MRLVLVEQTLFKSDKIDDRFEWLYTRIAEAESLRAAETQQLKGLFEAHKHEVDNKVTTQD